MQHDPLFAGQKDWVFFFSTNDNIYALDNQKGPLFHTFTEFHAIFHSHEHYLGAGVLIGLLYLHPLTGRSIANMIKFIYIYIYHIENLFSISFFFFLCPPVNFFFLFRNFYLNPSSNRSS